MNHDEHNYKQNMNEHHHHKIGNQFHAEHSGHTHSNHNQHGQDHHDHGHHHHGNFKELFLKSLPLGIIIMILSPMMGVEFFSVYFSVF